MKNRFQPIVLGLAFGLSTSLAGANDGDIEIKPVKVVDPKVERREVSGAAIDTESFEIGAYTGFLSVEDFNTNLLYGISGSYHLTDRWILQVNYGQSKVEKSTYEDIVGGSFLKSSDRDFEYIDLVAGYNIFPGRSFFGANSRYNSGVYLLAGVGNTSFGGDDNFTLLLGSSYRVVITDWLVGNLDFRDHIVDREFLGDSKTSHNIEMSLGLNFLF